MPTKNSSFLFRLFSILLLITLLFSVLRVAPAHAAGNIHYAKPTAGGTRDCSSWANACMLQTALTNAGTGDEIWVALGTHKPTLVATAREATFQLKSGVAVYGGFKGTETTRDQRKPAANPTILSGDIDNNDTNTDGNFIAETPADTQGNNAYHVVTSDGTTNTAVLDGFIITAGQANDTAYPNNYGGGIYNNGGSPSLRYITFSGNSAIVNGGGMYSSGSSNPTLTNITFSGNTAENGGGMQNNGSSPSLNSVTFTNNTASNGGGLYNSSGSPTLTNVTFSANSASFGGGMYNNSSDPALTNVTLSGNTASFGAGMQNSGSNPTLTNVTFSNNISNDLGGGMRNTDGSSPTLTDVTFAGNSASSGGGMFNDSSNPILTNVTFSTNSAQKGGGIYNNESSPTLMNLIFNDNSATSEGGGIYNNDGNPMLTNVAFSGNSAAVDGGGIYNENNSCPALMNVTFSANEATSHGGGMANSTSSNPTLTNVTFSGANDALYGGGMSNNASNPVLTNVTFSANSASFGGGMSNTLGSNPTLTNVTFSANTTTSHGGGMWNYNSSNPQIRNTIFWGNTADNAGAQIFNLELGGNSPIVSDSVVQDGCPPGSTCPNLITTNPLLGTLGDYGGYTQTIPLQAGSSAVDTGSDAVCPASDQRGVTRPQGAGCDIGAYEAGLGKLSPTNGITNQPLSSTLSWSSVEGATSYEYCYSSTAGPCTKWNSVGANTSVTLSGLAADYTYYWQVRAVDSGGTTEADSGTWWSFTTTTTSACTWPSYTPPATPTFGDVPMDVGHWSWVERLANSTITAGCGSGNYCPFNEVVRAQMAIFLLRGKHCGSSYTPPAVGASTGFGDVPLDATYAPWVKQLAAEGVTAGCGGGNFCPQTVVNRAQMAIFLLRARHGSTYSPPAVGATTGFGDVPLDASYAAWVKQLAAEGVTAGCGNGNFCPLQNVNRAQMATFLVRAFGLP
jgi:predicted outer membrane repeat protein